jgi:hypothetical protein
MSVGLRERSSLLTSLITLARFQPPGISRVENAVTFPLEVSWRFAQWPTEQIASQFTRCGLISTVLTFRPHREGGCSYASLGIVPIGRAIEAAGHRVPLIVARRLPRAALLRPDACHPVCPQRPSVLWREELASLAKAPDRRGPLASVCDQVCLSRRDASHGAWS